MAERDGTTFGPPVKVELPKHILSGSDWLWRITWHEGVAWGCVQQLGAGAERGELRSLRLMRSADAIHFEEVAQLDVDSPSETTLRFLPDNTMVAMIRCEGNDEDRPDRDGKAAVYGLEVCRREQALRRSELCAASRRSVAGGKPRLRFWACQDAALVARSSTRENARIY